MHKVLIATCINPPRIRFIIIIYILFINFTEWQDGVHQTEGVVSPAQGLSELGEHRAALLPVSLI